MGRAWTWAAVALAIACTGGESSAPKAELIYIPGYYTDVGNIALQARNLGLNVPLLGGDGWDSAKLAEIGGAAIEGSYYSNHYAPQEDRPAVHSFVEAYKARFGAVPDGLAALGYDATMVLADAMKRSPSLDGKDLAKAISETKDFAGVTGNITMDANRNAQKPAVIVQMKGGTPTFVASVLPDAAGAAGDHSKAKAKAKAQDDAPDGGPSGEEGDGDHSKAKAKAKAQDGAPDGAPADGDSDGDHSKAKAKAKAKAPDATPDAAPAAPPAPSGDTILVGEYGSLTGSEATFGQSTHNGVTLAQEQINAAGGINGKKLEIKVYDDQGKSQEAGTAVTRLITDDHVVAVIGEVASSLSLAGGRVAQQFSVPMISPSSTNAKVTEIGDMIFRVCFIDSFQGYVGAKFAIENLHVTRAAILYDQGQAYSKGLHDDFSKAFTSMGGTIVTEQAYTGGDQDFSAQLGSIR